MNCKCCDKPLKDSIRDGEYKSCPNCSQSNPHQEHIFYHSSAFGTTEYRVTQTNPDGIQSHCSKCRSGNLVLNGIECNRIIKK